MKSKFKKLNTYWTDLTRKPKQFTRNLHRFWRKCRIRQLSFCKTDNICEWLRKLSTSFQPPPTADKWFNIGILEIRRRWTFCDTWISDDCLTAPATEMKIERDSSVLNHIHIQYTAWPTLFASTKRHNDNES